MNVPILAQRDVVQGTAYTIYIVQTAVHHATTDESGTVTKDADETAGHQKENADYGENENDLPQLRPFMSRLNSPFSC